MAVHDVDLRVDAGERVALVGPSGAGKSSMLAAANGLVPVEGGGARLFGVAGSEVGHRSHRDTRARVGTVYQDLALVGSVRVATNVAAGRLGQWGRARALRNLVRPTDRDEILEILGRLGIAEKLWERTDRLSGGQQQRVAIARVLYQSPDLIIADEPVSNLDPARSRDVLDILVADREAHPDRALLVSIHDAPLALTHFTRIVGVREGRIVFDEPADSLAQRDLDELYAMEDTNGS